MRRLRRKQRVTQAEVAERLGCARTRINRAGQGRIELGIGELELLAEMLKTKFAVFQKSHITLGRMTNDE